MDPTLVRLPTSEILAQLRDTCDSHVATLARMPGHQLGPESQKSLKQYHSVMGDINIRAYLTVAFKGDQVAIAKGMAKGAEFRRLRDTQKRLQKKLEAKRK